MAALIMIGAFSSLARSAHSSHSADLGTSFDVIIRNASILDGTGSPAHRGDVAIKERRIVEVGRVDKSATAALVIDANGRYVSPGFIDVHTHCEDDLLTMPAAENFVRMGVTTVITGNCGSSYVNLSEAFTSHTKQGIGLNMASLVGHNSVRREVMKNVDRDPTTTEMAAMCDLVDKAMRDGAVGLSTGLIYPPGIWSKTPEIVELAKVASKYGGVYATHMRSEGGQIYKAIDEALTVAREAHIPLEISHFKITSPKHFGETSQTIGMVEKARQEGIDVTVDQYVYIASSTGISTMLPNWAVEGTTPTVHARLLIPENRRKIANEIISERRGSGRPNMSYAHVTHFKPDPSIDGMDLLAIAKKWKHSSSWEAQADTVIDIMTSGGCGMVFHSMDEADVESIARYRNTMFASDSGVREIGMGVPHPRGYGNNARVLSTYVRERKLFPVEEAVRRMTSLPAWRFKFADRGILKPGAIADVLVFDLARVNAPSTYQHPHAYAEGFDDVLVNGAPVILEGKLTGSRPGQIIYGPSKGVAAPSATGLQATSNLMQASTSKSIGRHSRAPRRR